MLLLKKFLSPFIYLKRKVVSKEIILVYTLGKVGSSTVAKTIKEVSPDAIVFQPHFLSNHYLTKILPKSNHYEFNIKVARQVNNTLKIYSNNKIKIITLVREPIERDISNVFQNPEDFIGNNSLLNMTSKELVNIYKSKENYDYTLNWFDNEFKQYTKIDLFKKNIDNTKKYFMFYEKEFDILLIKLEYLNDVGPKVLSEFLNINIERMANANEGNTKQSYELQKSFKKEYVPSKEILHEVFSSKYMQFFYSENEIISFRRKYGHLK